MLRRAGYSNHAIFLIWSTVLAARIVAAVLGKLPISNASGTPRCSPMPLPAARSWRW